jgi:hypothetical protein
VLNRRVPAGLGHHIRHERADDPETRTAPPVSVYRTCALLARLMLHASEQGDRCEAAQFAFVLALLVIPVREVWLAAWHEAALPAKSSDAGGAPGATGYALGIPPFRG